ncbi:MAG: LysM peptidoglycan-binding domain-containing protein [Burkholderiales bacterium]|nr:LysM peptidoglycan-binding domain-containing protein [Burkholderiales bacterium]
MLQQFTMALRIGAAALLTIASAQAQNLQLVDRPPETYTVQKGDTLWGISGKYLKEPWRWPDLWRMNRDEIRNPHLIYPGDVIKLSFVGGEPQLSVTRSNALVVEPTVRVSPLADRAIPSIPPNDLEPYLTRPLVTATRGLDGSAEILQGRDRSRVVRGTGDTVYVLGIDPKAGDFWYIYRPAGAIVNIDGTEVLGYENKFLGTARVEKFGDLATVRIESAVEEILIGDRLLPAPRDTLVNYVPHAPSTPIDARILRVPFGGLETARGGIVTLDKGSADGLEVGNVLAVYRVNRPIEDPRPSRQQTIILRYLDPTTVFTPREYVQAADERTGLLFVFRTFDRVAFGVVLNTTEPVRPGDFARTP